MKSETKIYGHRGVRRELPENTIESIEATLKLPGIAGVEFDVELSDEAIVLHQESMIPNEEFTALVSADRNYTDRDWVSEHCAFSIYQLDAGTWFDPAYAYIKVPSLEQVLQLPWGDKHALVELKDPTYWGDRDTQRPQQFVEKVVTLLKKFEGNLSVLSFNPEILRAVKPHLPEREMALCLWTEWQDKQEDALAMASEVGASTINISEPMLFDSADWLEKAHEAGLAIWVYPVSPTVEEPAYQDWTAQSRAEAWTTIFGMGVDGFITDFPRELMEFCEEE